MQGIINLLKNILTVAKIFGLLQGGGGEYWAGGYSNDESVLISKCWQVCISIRSLLRLGFCSQDLYTKSIHKNYSEK